MILKENDILICKKELKTPRDIFVINKKYRILHEKYIKKQNVIMVGDNDVTWEFVNDKNHISEHFLEDLILDPNIYDYFYTNYDMRIKKLKSI